MGSDRTAGRVIADRYRLVQKLGAGGMGEVWQAHHLGLDIPVAIKFPKVLPVESSSDYVRFTRECRALASVDSPHVVRILDANLEMAEPYLVMEYLPGLPLAKFAPPGSELPPPQVAAILWQIAEGLAAIHAAGVIHRDISPNNLFVVDRKSRERPENEFGNLGCAPQVKIVDLGLARLSHPDGGGPTTTAIVGSPRYMSPEQARCEPLDARTDCWSLGAVAFRLLTGSDPFEGECNADVLFAVCTSPVPNASARAKQELSLGYDAFFRRALARNRQLRHQTPKELAQEFAQLVDGSREPSSVTGETATLRTQAQSGHRLPWRGAALLWMVPGVLVLLLILGVPRGQSAVPPSPSEESGNLGPSAKTEANTAPKFFAPQEPSGPGDAPIETGVPPASLNRENLPAPSSEDTPGGKAAAPKSDVPDRTITRRRRPATHAQEAPKRSLAPGAMHPVFGIPQGNE